LPDGATEPSPGELDIVWFNGLVCSPSSVKVAQKK
jgi:hypothetical protein